jgi:hypothetical protein
MSAITVNKLVNDQLLISDLIVLDKDGKSAQDVTTKLNIVSGPAGGLGPLIMTMSGLVSVCTVAGAYQITLTSTNSAGSITSDAAGDTDGTVDAIIVVIPAPASQTFKLS